MDEEPSVKAVEWPELLFHFVKRPAMYGISKVEDLDLIILGMRIAATGRLSEEIHDFQTGFREFMNKRCAYEFTSERDYDWARLIRFNSSGDSHSIELFGRAVELYQTFLEGKYKFEEDESENED